MRTFTRAQLDEANAAWKDGDFSREWRDVRHKAAMGGIIYPPSGTKWDNWEDDSPSQRAIVIRAIRETPKLLDKCLVGAKSWNEVVGRLTRARDEWRDQQYLAERDALDRRDDPDHRESVMALSSILKRIGDSA